MNKVKFVLFSAGISLALALTFSCSSGGGGGGGEDGNAQLSSSSLRQKSSSSLASSSSSVQNSSGSEQSYKYCITADGCLEGPFTASTCTGQLSNSCPNGSSPSVGGSSSSVRSSSSSSVQSSSSKGSSSSSGGGVSFNENSQIYNYYKDGSLYKGSGVIKMLSGYGKGDINAGNVTNGIVNLNLPSTISDEYLSVCFLDKLSEYCTDYTEGIKEFGGSFVLTDINGDFLGDLVMLYEDETIVEGIAYDYYSKAGKITCDYEKDTGRNIYKMDIKAGWTKIYCRINYANGSRIKECNTNNILTKEKELKWVIEQ